MRWAARYTFCDPLWRGRARLIVDAELEAVLREVVVDRRAGTAPWRELLDALLPRERGVPVWMLVGSEEAASVLAPHWPGVRFLALDAIEDRIARAPWEIALLTITRDGDGWGALEGVLGDVGAAMGRGRTAVVAALADDLDYESFSNLIGPSLPQAKVYGGYAPSMFAFVEFDADGDELADDEDDDVITGIPTHPGPRGGERWDDDDDDVPPAGEDEDEGVPLSFDNTLVGGEPALSVWIAIASESSDFAEGLTLVELPEGGGGDGVVASALRRQLHETRRLADLSALERQRLVERVDALEGDNATLREALTQLREQLAGALDPGVSAERLDAALSREQSLRWRVAALERELAELRVRPVDELTADNEQLRARLQAAQQRDTDVPPRREPEPREPVETDGVPPRRFATPDAARRLAGGRAAGSGRTAALRVLEALVRRVEVGQLDRASLRRELAALRRRLRG
ncbi:MAG: hypothetical protein K1X88_07150 [Nannocystaceae bacterium]|nr:hypothetical protein [Nannocystaceae bacterium]